MNWKAPDTPRRAGVNSFGFGGTNAHVILEEAPAVSASGPSRPYQLLVLSAKTPSALDATSAQLVEHLQTNDDLNLADVAYTLQVGRRAFGRRRVLVSEDRQDAIDALERLDAKRVFNASPAAHKRSVIFMFTGQGAQHVHMASELYRHEPVFRGEVDRCAEVLQSHLGLDLREVLYPDGVREAEAALQLQETWLTQPTLFTIEYALAQLWRSWGIRPLAMIGHSLGEFVAATLAGVLSPEAALALVASRGKLMQALPHGAMLAVARSESELEPLLGQELSIAAINGPSRCVVSGPVAAVEALEQRFQAEGAEGYRRLKTSHAFHSAMMEPILASFLTQVQQVRFAPPQIPYVSNVTGDWITDAQAMDPQYWIHHLRHTVRFNEGLQTLCQTPDQVLLEIGPGQTLATFAKQYSNRDRGQTVLASLGQPQKRPRDLQQLLHTVGQLWLAGVEIDWDKFHAHERRQRIPLPTYPFERQSYWIDTPASSEPHQPASGNPIADWFYSSSWKRTRLTGWVAREPVADQASSWLILKDRQGVGDRLAEQLADAGHDVVTATIGDRFVKLREDAYLVNPWCTADYEALLEELAIRTQPLRTMIHLWSLAPSPPDAIYAHAGDFVEHVGFRSLLALAPALTRYANDTPLRLEVVTNQTQEVIDTEVRSPEQATVFGLCRAMAREVPNLTCQTIDVMLSGQDRAAVNALSRQLLAELTTPSQDAVVAYRGTHRWVWSLDAVRLNDHPKLPERLRQGGIYLITSGFSPIGQVLTAYLAQTFQAKLILVESLALPEKQTWHQYLTNQDESSEIYRKIRHVQELEACGGEVLLLTADIAQGAQARSVLAQSIERFGTIHGVIYIAGNTSTDHHPDSTPSASARVVASKIKEVRGLAEQLPELSLDFFTLLSSLPSPFSGMGRFSDCAIHSFLDAFAYYQAARTPFLTASITWDTWREEPCAHPASPGNDNAQGLWSAEQMEAFRRLLGHALSQVVVSPLLASPERAPIETGHGSNPSKPPARARNSESRYARPALENPYLAPRNDLEQRLANIWQDLLGIAQIGIEDSFFELGGDSLMATQLRSRLHEVFAVELPLHVLLEAHTLGALAEAITQSCNEITDRHIASPSHTD